MAIVAVVAVDVGVVAWRPMTHAFATKMPATSESTGPFRTEEHLPEELLYGVHQVPLTLTAEMANIGTIDCATFPGLNNFVRDARGRTPGLGAHGASDPEYRGEAFVAEGFGTAAIEKWTPNQVTVSIHGATAGEHVVLNQNWDGGWMANGARALNVEDRAGALLGAGDQTVIFQYCPRTFWPGVAFFVATAGGIGAAWAAHKMRASQQR